MFDRSEFVGELAHRASGHGNVMNDMDDMNVMNDMDDMTITDALPRAESPKHLFTSLDVPFPYQVEGRSSDACILVRLHEVGAVLLHQTVEEFERVSRLLHLVEGVNHLPAIHVFVEEIHQVRRCFGHGTGSYPCVAEVEQRGSAPGEFLDQILLVESSLAEEIGTLSIEELAEFERQQEFQTHARHLKNLVSKKRPDQRFHPTGVAADHDRLIHAIDEYHDPLHAEQVENSHEILHPSDSPFLSGWRRGRNRVTETSGRCLAERGNKTSGSAIEGSKSPMGVRGDAAESVRRTDPGPRGDQGREEE
jgi:hypothetical protein